MIEGKDHRQYFMKSKQNGMEWDPWSDNDHSDNEMFENVCDAIIQ